MKKLTFITSSLLAPFLSVSAQGLFEDGIEDGILTLQGIVNSLSTLLIGVCVIVIIWGVIQWIWKSDSDEDRKKGSKKIITGIVGLFIVVSLWGLVTILQDISGVDQDNASIPDLIPTS